MLLYFCIAAAESPREYYCLPTCIYVDSSSRKIQPPSPPKPHPSLPIGPNSWNKKMISATRNKVKWETGRGRGGDYSPYLGE